ncbi:N-glycosylase [archaeon]|nr:N-glycosylase [archaeon]
MKKLLKELEILRNSKIKPVVNQKMKEFKELGKRSNKELFKELCFCLLTANYNAVGGIKIQKAINNGFYTLNEKQLSKKLKELGHRFPNARAKYIAEAQQHKTKLKSILANTEDQEAREWLVQNVKGLGMKEASHFLRNIGHENLAIIDFHIIDILADNKLIEKPKTMTPNKYLEIEQILKDLGKKINMNMSELDLYLWYMETGKILK